MAPIRDYLCNYCGHEFEQVVFSSVPEDYQTAECRCGSKAVILPAMIGGMHGNFGTPRRKDSTSMPKKKVYTGKPGNQGEPEDSQLDLNFNGNKK